MPNAFCHGRHSRCHGRNDLDADSSRSSRHLYEASPWRRSPPLAPKPDVTRTCAETDQGILRASGNPGRRRGAATRAWRPAAERTQSDPAARSRLRGDSSRDRKRWGGARQRRATGSVRKDVMRRIGFVRAIKSKSLSVAGRIGSTMRAPASSSSAPTAAPTSASALKRLTAARLLGWLRGRGP